MLTAPDGTRTPSGIEVYAVRDLTDVEQQIDGLTRSAAGTAALALPLAVLLALLAARQRAAPGARTPRHRAPARPPATSTRARRRRRAPTSWPSSTVTVNEMAESVQTSMATMQRMQADARRFAADVSHELRTPLSTLTAVVEVLADDGRRTWRRTPGSPRSWRSPRPTGWSGSSRT